MRVYAIPRGSGTLSGWGRVELHFDRVVRSGRALMGRVGVSLWQTFN